MFFRNPERSEDPYQLNCFDSFRAIPLLLYPQRGGAGIYVCVSSMQNVRLQTLRESQGFPRCASEFQKNYSSCFPFVSGNWVAISAVRTNAIAHSKNAALSPF